MKLNSITCLFCLSGALLLVPLSTSLASIYSSTFSYDVANGKVTKTDPNNKRLEYSYDVVNRLSGIKLLDAAGVPEFKYYYDLTDQLERITYPGGEQIFAYDDFDRLESIKDFGQTSPLLAFDYDHKDRITWITYPDGGEVCYEYDPDGRMTRVGRVLPPGGASLCSAADEITDLNYDVKGRLETIDYPNGVQKFQEYSVTTGQITRVGYRKQPSGDLIYSDTFVYIPNSNLYDIVTRTASGGSEVSDYDYDDYQRLTEVVEANGRKTVFEYDDFGNRTRETITNINNPTATGGTPKAYGDYQYIYGPRSNRLVRILKDGVELERFVYDNAGRISQRTHAVNGVTEYTFDDRGYLTKVVKPTSTIEYTYDALGVRKTKTVDGVTTRYLTANIFGFSHVLMELDTAMNIKSTYMYAGHLPLKEEPVAADRNQDLYLLHSGVVGSITHALDGAGNIKHEYSYDAFGNRSNVSATGSSHQHYGYTGEEYDEETGLLYLRARYYDPMLGRFISADPYWGRLEEPVTQNRFIYVHNNPLSLADPSGLASDGKRGLEVLNGTIPPIVGTNPIYDKFNTEIVHQQIWFDKPVVINGINNGNPITNIGFFGDNGMFFEPGVVRPDVSQYSRNDYVMSGDRYDDDVMAKAVNNIINDWQDRTYFVEGGVLTFDLGSNCQDFVDAAITEYRRIAP